MPIVDMSIMNYTDLLEDSFPAREPKGFHLYFAGSQNILVEKYLYKLGANRLGSQLLDRKGLQDWINARTEGICKGRLMIDSGAYSAYTQGTELDVDEYIEYLNSIDDHTDVIVQVDTPPGNRFKDRTAEDYESGPRLSWENYLYMREKVLSVEKLVPVFHMGESYKWLENMLEWKDSNGKHIPYIGIAPLHSSEANPNNRSSFIDRCFEIINRSSNPNVKTHAFGMTKLSVLEAYPFTSADSTSWILCAVNGSIMTPFGTVPVSEKSAHNPNHYLKLPEEGRKVIDDYVKSYGFGYGELRSQYAARICLNILYLLDWAENYKYTPAEVRRRRLF